jgi:hypothetical protein
MLKEAPPPGRSSTAGNARSTTTVTESGSADVEF